MGRAARARAARQAAGEESNIPTFRYEPKAHDHRLGTCKPCQEREDHVAILAHRVRQQNEIIVALQTLIDTPRDQWSPAFRLPRPDRSLPGRTS